MAVIGFSYAMYLSTQVKLVPYIVEVDKLGNTVNRQDFPEQIEYADARVVRATLGNFVTSFRSITPDAVVQKQYIDRTYALLRTPIRRPRRSIPGSAATRHSKRRECDRRHRGQQHRGAVEPDLPDRLDRIRAGPQGQGNRDTPISRHRHGGADPAAGRGDDPAQPDRPLCQGFRLDRAQL
jgi:hypothetical protein